MPVSKQEMTKYCTATALAVRTFITGSDNLNRYGQSIRDIADNLGLRVDDYDNLNRTRGSWLGKMVDFLGQSTVDSIYQLIKNNDKKPADWGASVTTSQTAALNIQRKTEVYESFKLFSNLWAAGNHHPSWDEEAGVLGTSTKQDFEKLAVSATSNAAGNCGETSLLGFLLLSSLPNEGKYKATYNAMRGLTVGWYGGTNFDHAYVIVSNNGYSRDKTDENLYCVCDPWLGRAYPSLQGNLHYDKNNSSNVGLINTQMPEVKIGGYTFASESDDLTKIQGVMQILYSAFYDEFMKL